MLTRNSAAIFRSLGGILNVYKPSGVSVKRVMNAIVTNVCKDLNQLNVREPRQRLLFERADENDENSYKLEVVQDPADNVKVVGERHQISDFKCQPAISMGYYSSGVLLLGINSGTRDAFRIRMNRSVRVYRVTGRLGKATETHFADSKVIARSSYDHVSRTRISSLLSSVQASHQRKMFEDSGVDIQSETAYNLATQGTIRPASSNTPVIYGIELVELMRPKFTIEIHSLNENENYLASLIHDIGLELRTVAYCSSIRCIRSGHFCVEDSLLRRNWTLSPVLENLQKNAEILNQNPSITRQYSSSLITTDDQNSTPDSNPVNRINL
ncbi:pseudouridylate synthase TRUB2, mitochondrial [Phlebotomus argentipes]|uniref:pseudouridylate synthase TRUB2, mitochondrial n=1 Tax=Phlebotomus argentipes TaxID=94469 RepID=UPI002892AA8E|nr:pseudouridylate synthase TRUB2, mitochondrial [Phlebotomus argentipes]